MLDTIKKQLRRYRQEQGLTQRQIANKMNVGETFLTRFESPKNSTSWVTLQKYAKALGHTLHVTANKQ